MHALSSALDLLSSNFTGIGTFDAGVWEGLKDYFAGSANALSEIYSNLVHAASS